jgi:hypothetical protein
MNCAALALALVFVCLPAARASADERYFAMAVGYNGRPSAADPDAPALLRYADDDAISCDELENEAGNDAVLLAAPDADSRRRFPWAVDVARPPTMSEIERAVSDLNKRIDAATSAGHRPVFLFFYSGHGSHPQDTEAALSLLDGELPGSALREQVLDKVHAHVIHLIIDACHAEAVVRPRDLDAKTTAVTQAEIMAQLST